MLHHLWVLALTWPPVAVGTMIVVLSAALAAGVMLAVEPWTTSCLSRLPDAAPFLQRGRNMRRTCV